MSWRASIRASFDNHLIHVTSKRMILLALVSVSSLFALFLFRSYEVNQQNKKMCVQIEKLKQLVRDEAWNDFNDLNKNLRLLNIPKTPEIERAAKARRDGRLRRFQSIDCSHL